MQQRCKADKVVVDGNWEGYMWPHQIDKTPRLHPEVFSFLKKLNLSSLTGIFVNQGVLTMDVLLALNEKHLEAIGLKLGDRINILNETHKLKQQPTVKPEEKITQAKSPRSETQPPPVKKKPEPDPPYPLDPELPSSIHQSNYSKVKFRKRGGLFVFCD